MLHWTHWGLVYTVTTIGFLLVSPKAERNCVNTLCARQRILVLDETSFSSRRLEAFRHRPRKESSRVLILHVVSENFSGTRCCGEVWMFCSRNPHASTRTFSLSTPQESVIPLIIADNTELSTYRLCERNAHRSFKLKICSVFSGRTGLCVRFLALFPSWFLSFYTHSLILCGTRLKNSTGIHLHASCWKFFMAFESMAKMWLRNFWNIQMIGVLLGFCERNRQTQ